MVLAACLRRLQALMALPLLLFVGMSPATLLACTCAFSMEPYAFSFPSYTSSPPHIKSWSTLLICQFFRRILPVACWSTDYILHLPSPSRIQPGNSTQLPPSHFLFCYSIFPPLPNNCVALENQNTNILRQPGRDRVNKLREWEDDQ